jgi:poly-gamma-glutamate synthesis protein (capsule biosynthesis protein)
VIKKHNKVNAFLVAWIITSSILVVLGLFFYASFAIWPHWLQTSNTTSGVAEKFEGVVGKVGGSVVEKENTEVSLIAVGDNMLSRDVARKINAHGVDYPYDKTRDYLTNADITFGNLETPITPGPSVPVSSLTFHSDPKVVPGLSRAGFDIFSLANNHTPNYGQGGLLDTFKYLTEAGIKYVGAGKNAEEAEAPVFMETRGIKFAFLAYNDTDVVPDSYGATSTRAGTNFMSTTKVQKAVQEAKKEADIVIVSMHSGIEYTATPDSSQKNFAHAAIDAGADIVIGHHPHVAQTLEKYNGKFIIYSLGNFVFDQMWSTQTQQGMTAKVFFTNSGVNRIEFHPVRIHDYAQPRLLEGTEKDTVLSRLQYPLVDGIAR